MARPAGADGPLPAVLVVHENRGLNPYIEDVVRRVAKAGYIAFGPDGLSPLGGYPGTDEEGREMQAQIDGAKLMEDFFAGYEFLRDHDDIDRQGRLRRLLLWRRRLQCARRGLSRPRRVGAVLRPPARRRRRARDPGAADAALCRARRAHQRGLAGLRGRAEGARQGILSVHFYPDVNHGFHNDTTPRYDEAAATLAWDRTLAFFDEHLR